jgi:putative SOS response-associated peptidase YedK
MCYYTDQQSSKNTLEKRFEAFAKFQELELAKGKQSGFNRPALPVITQGKPDLIQLMPWGLVPSWADEQQAKELPSKTLNAKTETVFEKASFEPSIYKQRCLVLVDGFFEWQHIGKEKIEYEIGLTQDGPFALAGIYAIWRNPRSQQLEPSFSILTTPANELMEEIHNTKKRMPLILPFESEKEWINGMPTEQIKSYFKPFPSTKMRAKKQSKESDQLRLF